MHITEGSEKEYKIKLFENASIYARVVCGVLLAALILEVVALSTSWWVAVYAQSNLWYHEGLFHICTQNIYTVDSTFVCLTYDSAHHSDKVPTWIKVTQAFSIMGLIALVPATFLAILFSMLPKLSGRKFCSILAITFCIVSGAFLLIGLAVYVGKYPKVDENVTIVIEFTQHFHFSLGFQVISMLGSFVAAILLFLDLRTSIIL